MGLVRSPELQVVNDLMEEHGLRLYTRGCLSTRISSDTSLATACWGRPLSLQLSEEELGARAVHAGVDPELVARARTQASAGRYDTIVGVQKGAATALIDLIINERAVAGATKYNKDVAQWRSKHKLVVPQDYID